MLTVYLLNMLIIKNLALVFTYFDSAYSLSNFGAITYSNTSF